jgi:hypothetical protein
MKTEKKFPRTFRSSSAANRAVRQYEEKHGKHDFVVEKIHKNMYVASLKTETINLVDFVNETKEIQIENLTFRYYSDGLKGEGYYELKTGERRRPNSIFYSVNEVYETQMN